MKIIFAILIGFLAIIPTRLVPLPAPMVGVIFDALHFPGGIILGALIASQIKDIRIVFAIGIALILGIEIVQPYFNRARDLIDVLVGLGGLYVGVVARQWVFKVVITCAWFALIIFECLKLSAMNIESANFGDFNNYFARKTWDKTDYGTTTLRYVEHNDQILAKIVRRSKRPNDTRYWGISKPVVSFDELQQKITGIEFDTSYAMTFTVRAVVKNTTAQPTQKYPFHVRADGIYSHGMESRINKEFEISTQWSDKRVVLNANYGPLKKVAFFSNANIDYIELKNIRVRKL